jgi:long-subunit acyl-CoA synthetase (AMP-forming)
MSTVETMVQDIARHARERGSVVALREMDDDGKWASSTWDEYWMSVRAIGKGLMALGHQPGDIVGLVSNNRREWVFCQHGAAAAGGVVAPVYPTSTPEQTGYIISHCDATIAICDSEEQLDKFLECLREKHFAVKHIITIDAIDVGERADGLDVDVITLADLMERGAEVDDADLDERLDAVEPDGLALLIFTSGTTGLPKGAEYTHVGIRTVVDAVKDVYSEMWEAERRYISYLPLSHVAEQVFTNFVGLAQGGVTYFCRDIKKVKEYLPVARPTVFFAVPRVWEKFEAALRSKLGAATGIKAKLAEWALKTELEHFERQVATGIEQVSWKRSLANKLVISKIQQKLGLDELILAGSGAAPIARGTLDFFASLGIEVSEGYGMTETSGVATVQPFGRPRFGTVGKALPCVDVRIADDGEIMLRGKNMIRGYLQLPEKTAELFTDDWMHTGDIGELDDEGFLKITGRKKDLIITAGGKNIAPAEIEGHLQTIPGVGQAVVVGDRQPYLCALLALDEEALGDLASAAGVSKSKITDLAKSDKVREFVQKCIDEGCNSKLARYQTIKKFEILPHAFSVDGGELTPTLKVKRNVVNDKYADTITSMYG